MTTSGYHDVTLKVGAIAMLSIGLMIGLLLLWILILRTLRHRRDARRKRITTVWRPLLVQCLFEVPEVLPSLSPKDHQAFLYLWNHCFESIRGDAGIQLVALARRLGLDRVAKDLLHARSLHRRLLAIVTLGHLQERTVWNELAGLLQDANAFLSFVSAKALLHIDLQAAIPLLIPVISRRGDWSPLKVVSMLKELGPDLAAPAIAQAAIAAATPEIGARLIRHLAATRSVRGLPPLRQYLQQHTPHNEMLSACLFVFGECCDPIDLPFIRRHLAHDTWYIRLQAAVALGKIGGEEDEARLVALLDDPHWWVRYRAGEALVSLPSMTSEKLGQLQVNLTTLESQEILTPLLAKYRKSGVPSVPTG